jgi:fibronectin type 3 domain-containing protein
MHTVTLSWTASTSTNVVGYYVYRGTVAGGPFTKVTSSPVPGTSYTDNAVQSGLTYFYVATAVDSGGNESGNSNQAQAVIPGS